MRNWLSLSLPLLLALTMPAWADDFDDFDDFDEPADEEDEEESSGESAQEYEDYLRAAEVLDTE
jgi:hypothetical protein